MLSYPIEIRRCRHIRTNGTQCGSPALKEKELCYFHQGNQPKVVELYLDGDRYADGSLILPVFEDAHSIQSTIRLVVQLMLSHRIDRKDASLMLYALQIASGNLKTMQAEKARPTRVVVDPEKAAETPLGMTPWSATSEKHEIEEDADIAADRAVKEVNQRWETVYRNSRQCLVDSSEYVDERLGETPTPTQSALLSMLGTIRSSLQQSAKSMEEQLLMQADQAASMARAPRPRAASV
jgi:hypothetical protein